MYLCQKTKPFYYSHTCYSYQLCDEEKFCCYFPLYSFSIPYYSLAWLSRSWLVTTDCCGPSVLVCIWLSFTAFREHLFLNEYRCLNFYSQEAFGHMKITLVLQAEEVGSHFLQIYSLWLH